MNEDNKYYIKLWSGALAVFGLYFILEHLIVWGSLDFFDLFGHEQFGLLFLIFGILGLYNYEYPEWLKKENGDKFKWLKK